jgi:phosphoglycerol transferase MdoB-like AlkP superfamily enzyme
VIRRLAHLSCCNLVHLTTEASTLPLVSEPCRPSLPAALQVLRQHASRKLKARGGVQFRHQRLGRSLLGDLTKFAKGVRNPPASRNTESHAENGHTFTAAPDCITHRGTSCNPDPRCIVYRISIDWYQFLSQDLSSVRIFWGELLSAKLRAALGFLFVYLIVPNLPIWLFVRRLSLAPHGYFNVECLFVGILALFLPRAIVFLLLFFEMLCSFVYLVCYTYQFSLGSLFLSLHYLSLLPTGRLHLVLPALALILLLSAIVAFAVAKPAEPNRRIVVAALLICGILLVGFDTLNGRNPVWPRDSSDGIPRLTISPVAALTKRAVFLRRAEVFAHSAKDREMRSASAEGISFLNKTMPNKSPNVVLVVVESWGLLRNMHLASAIDSSYSDQSIQSNYRVQFGTAPFNGLTVPGEARELCHSSMGFGILNPTASEKEHCLPQVFHHHGYEDIAIHGYVGAMFNRQKWYPSIGFDQMYFKPQLFQAGLPICEGAFPGICDGAIADWIGNHLLSGSSEKPLFIYWVTLNSHLPVPQNPNLPPDQTCALYPELVHSTTLCSWFRLVSQVHQSIQKVALRTQNRPTVFIVVGDHAPPFSNPELRAQFSRTDVPFVILTPRSISQ